MKSSATQKHQALIVAMTGAFALGLAGCEQKPPAKSSSQPFNSAVENAARPVQSTTDASGQKADQLATGDAALAAKVKSALVSDPELKSLTVDVNAADGVVTLFGTADDSAKSHQAAVVALNVDGVRSVKNELIVLRGS